MTECSTEQLLALHQLRDRLRQRITHNRHPVVVTFLVLSAVFYVARLLAGEPMVLLRSLPHGEQIPVTWLLCFSTLTILVATVMTRRLTIAAVLAEMVGWSVLGGVAVLTTVDTLLSEQHWYDAPFLLLVFALGHGGLVRVLSLIPVVLSWTDRGALLLLRKPRWISGR